MTCPHRILAYYGLNAGVYCIACGTFWRRRRRHHRGHPITRLARVREPGLAEYVGLISTRRDPPRAAVLLVSPADRSAAARLAYGRRPKRPKPATRRSRRPARPQKR